MNAFVLHDTSDANGALRWGTSATLIVSAHAALIALGMAWYTQRPPPGVMIPTILVDMAPVTASPQPTPMDIAPGPEMQAADASPPVEQATPETVREQLEATPPQLTPEVEAPPEAKPEPAPPKPEPARIVPDPAKPVQEKPRPVRKEARKPTEAPPAPRTTATPRAERQAPAASAISAGASAAAVASYNQMVAAHLQRFKQYPPAAKAAGQQGVSRLRFSLSRSGQVLSSGLGGSSGHAALDAETLAMVRRAQPFPAFPPDMKQASMSFSVPIQFSVR
ncbi:MAG: TonB family protein [Bradyrhizobium sp.]|uniref:energy transducer TonB n=1 Tax=Bradyrhizobium sp. TaxID=376 RepID=UPI002719D77D|nr:TonB family protein [Bradyrhizobium sp.]MDO8400419.1 TonB family protein [Bradyrhizobium sp.]